MPKNKWTRTVFTLALVLFCANLLLIGQTTTGGITGFVKDSSGAVIPGAKVTLTNINTGAKLQAVTSSQGIYTFPGLQVGTYSVLAASSGFASQERTGLLVNANEIVSADMQLAVGSAETLVEVLSTTTPIIDTQTSTLTSVIPNAVLETMPELTWQHGDVGVYGVVFYSPGVVMPGVNHLGVSGSDTGSSPPISGARQLDTMDTMDGMTVMAYVDNEGGGPVQPSRQAIQEIHTVLANAPAEFWRTAALTVVTKTGTNQFHGSAFEDYNGSAFNSRSWFTSKVPFRVYNNFGGAIGGPIMKNKLFFFFDYEGSREASQVPAVANVPLPAWRTGNFSSLSTTITNPYTGKPFVGNIIPANMISPVSTSLVNFFYPQPNFGAPGLLSGNYQALENADTGYTVFNHFDASINWNIKDKDAFYVRGSYRLLPRVTFGSVGIGGTLPCCSFGFSHRLGASGVVEETHIFSPTVLNEVRFGFTEMRNPSYGNVNGQAVLAQAGLAGALVSDPGLGFPAFSISGLSAVPGKGTSLIRGIDYEWNDNLSWTRGRHSLKFGFDQIFDTAVGFTYPSTIFGGYTFNGKFTGNGFADLLLGLPQQTTRTTPPPNFDIHGILLGAFAQDQYKVSERLTLNYGLRYEYQAPYYSTNGLSYGFDPKTGAVVVANQSVSKVSPFFPSTIPVETAQVAGYPSNSMMFGHKLNFYPRAGFNYLVFPSGNTVLRGGFGLYANNIYGQAGIAQGSAGGPFIGSATYTNAFVNGAPLFSFPNPYLSSGAAASQTITVTNPHVSLPYTEQWNLTVEQKLSPTISLNIGYVGTYSSRLLYPSNFNQPPPSTTPYSASKLLYPNFHAVNWNVNGGTANYNALQVSASKTYGHNAFFSTGLTWAKDLTDDLDSGSFNGSAPQNIYCLRCEYGNNGLTRKITSYINSSYVLPLGRGQHFLTDVNRWEDAAIGGWSVAFIGMLTSGNYFTPYINSGFDTANTNTSFIQRPDQIANPQVSSPGIKNWFNIKAYATPGCPASDPLCAHTTPVDVGRFGNTRNDSLVGPNFINFNASVSKNFHLSEQATLQLRANATDVFNHANFDIPDQYVTDGPGVAGVITALSAANLSQATSGARQLAFGARFTF